VFCFLNSATKIILVWFYPLKGVIRGGKETTTAKKGHSPEAVTKKGVSFLERKNSMTPSVATPGDTNPSDATGRIY